MKRYQMKTLRRSILLLLCTVTGVLSPVQALAASPEFARTDEEWAKLQDQLIEYGELADLIHEYNVTVQNNQQEYNEFIKDYGHTNEENAQAYRDLADDLSDSISGEDDASSMVSDLQLELQIKQLLEQADDAVDDSKVYYLTYAMAEDNLVVSAQSSMITYRKQLLELENAKDQLEILNTRYQLAQTQLEAGTATEMDVLTAKESLLSCQSTVENLESSLENTRQKLIVMLGWSHGDNPEIGDLPEVTEEQIAAIDLAADKEKALETNYTLLINKRKFENADDNSTQETLSNTIKNNEGQIKNSVGSAYSSLVSSNLAFTQAKSELALEQKNTALAAQKRSAGMITDSQYQEQASTLKSKENSEKTAAMDLLQAYETYQWNVNGLANAS